MMVLQKDIHGFPYVYKHSGLRFKSLCRIHVLRVYKINWQDFIWSQAGSWFYLVPAPLQPPLKTEVEHLKDDDPLQEPWVPRYLPSQGIQRRSLDFACRFLNHYAT